jgi:hypothetical protein
METFPTYFLQKGENPQCYTNLSDTLIFGDGEGVIGGVNRERERRWGTVTMSLDAFGVDDSNSGVCGGVSGLILFQRTGNARFC